MLLQEPFRHHSALEVDLCFPPHDDEHEANEERPSKGNR